jgi:Domain of unknown function (DUF397)
MLVKEDAVTGERPRRSDEWRRSSLCENGACVEIALVGEVIVLRNSESPDGPVLTCTPENWAAFLTAIKDGVFDSRGSRVIG